MPPITSRTVSKFLEPVMSSCDDSMLVPRKHETTPCQIGAFQRIGTFSQNKNAIVQMDGMAQVMMQSCHETHSSTLIGN